MHIIPVNQTDINQVPTLPSQQLRYYADILEEANAPETEDSKKLSDVDEIEHEGKSNYTEYKK